MHTYIETCVWHWFCCCFMRVHVCVAFAYVFYEFEARVSCGGNCFMNIKRRGTLFVELCARCIPFNGMSVNVEIIINVLMTTTTSTAAAAAAKQRPKHNVCQHRSELVLFETFYHKERWNIATLPSRSELCGTAIPLCIVYVVRLVFVVVVVYFSSTAFLSATCALCTINRIDFVIRLIFS